MIAVPAFFPNNVLFSGLVPLKLAPASVPAIVLPCASLVTPPELRPVKADQSPAKAVAVQVPVTVKPPVTVSAFFALLKYNSTAPPSINFAMLLLLALSVISISSPLILKCPVALS